MFGLVLRCAAIEMHPHPLARSNGKPAAGQCFISDKEYLLAEERRRWRAATTACA
jgi:hypothetical protein